MKHKLATMGFSYLAGLICASFLPSLFALALCAAAAAGASVFAVLKKLVFAVVLFVFGAAAGVYGIYTILVYEPAVALAGTSADITGTVTEASDYGNDLCAYTVRTNLSGADVSISVYAGDCGAKIGDEVSFTATLKPMSDSVNFAERSYYKTKGIFLKASVSGGITVTERGGFSLLSLADSFRERIKTRISLFLPGDEGKILCAFFLGDKSELPDELSSGIKYAGVSHFAAVSGLHLTEITHIVMLLLALTPLRRRKRLSFLVLTALILFSMMCFRFTPSVIRAGIMLIVYYGAVPLRRKAHTMNSIGAAALIILLMNPYAALDIGFLLSITGTVGVGVAAPAICKRLRQGRFTRLRDSLVGSGCAVLFTLPLSAAFFGGISTVGILVNMLIYPLFLPALACFVLFALVGGHGAALMFVAGLCAKGMLKVITFFSGLEYSYIPLDQRFVLPFLILAAVFAVGVWFITRDHSRTAMSCGICICLLAFLLALDSVLTVGETKVHFFSDGDDGCVMIVSPDGAIAAATDDSPKIAAAITDFLKCNYIGELSVLYLADSAHNNAAEFAEILAAVRTGAGCTDELYSCGALSLDSRGESCTLSAGQWELVISPAASPSDGANVLLYGYKKNPPVLSADTVYFSSKRVESEEAGRFNLYYENCDFSLTPSGVIKMK